MFIKEFTTASDHPTHNRSYKTGKCLTCERFRQLPNKTHCRKHMELTKTEPAVAILAKIDTVSGGVHTTMDAKQSELLGMAERMINQVMSKAFDLDFNESECRVSIFVSVRQGFDVGPDGAMVFTGDPTAAPVIEHVPYESL